MKILIENVNDGDRIPNRVLLLRGRIMAVKDKARTEDCNISLKQKFGRALLQEDDEDEVGTNGIVFQTETMRRSRFKFLVRLHPGENKLTLQPLPASTSSSYTLSVFYKAPNGGFYAAHPIVKLVYILCRGDEGRFQAPTGTRNDVESAKERIALAAELVQCFTSDCINCHEGLGRRTFDLETASGSSAAAAANGGDDEEEGRPVVHVLNSSLTLDAARAMTSSELWKHHARELIESQLHGDNVKFLAVMSATRYTNPSGKQPTSHSELLSMVEAHAALGGGGLGLFGSGCLYTWPARLEEVKQRFEDKTKVDWSHFMDDSAYRHTFGGCFSTSLGSIVHELGHCFDLVHTEAGVMARGFDDVDRYFTVKETESVEKKPTSKLTLVRFGGKSDGDSERQQEVASSRFTKISNKTPGSALLERYYHKQDYEHMRAEFGGCFWMRQSALMLYHHRWLHPAENTKKSTLSVDNDAITSHDSDVVVVDARDEDQNSVGFLEPRSKVFPLDQVRKLFPKAVEVCAINGSGAMIKHDLKKE